MTQKILIVDDDLDTLRLVGLLLERKGYEIIVADNGRQGLAKAASEIPDLILLDVMMPEIDGVEVLRRLRSDPKTARIPIIMFTAKSQVEDKVLGFESGADDYLTKPTHPAELIARVRTILARSAAKHTSGGANGSERDRGKVSCILGAKGGMGATTFAINLGIAIQESSGKKCVVAELRPGVGSAGLMLGIDPNESLPHLLRKSSVNITGTDVSNALVQHSSGLDVLLASYQPSDTKFSTAGDQMATIVEQLATSHDYILVDPGPGLSPASAKIIEKCDTIYVLVEPVYPTVLQTKALLEELRMKVLGLGAIQIILLTRVKFKAQMPLGDIQKELGHSITASLGAEPEIAYECLAQGMPISLLHPTSIYAQQIHKIVKMMEE